MFNKRGQGLSVNAIIMIVLGVVVLAVLILGFTMGWGNIKDRISPSNNVKTIADACSVACGTQSVFDYCTTKREIKMDDDALKTVNDDVIQKDVSISDLVVGNKYTCNDLLKYPKLGIQDCKSICPKDTPSEDDGEDETDGE